MADKSATSDFLTISILDSRVQYDPYWTRWYRNMIDSCVSSQPHCRPCVRPSWPRSSPAAPWVPISTPRGTRQHPLHRGRAARTHRIGRHAGRFGAAPDAGSRHPRRVVGFVPFAPDHRAGDPGAEGQPRRRRRPGHLAAGARNHARRTGRAVAAGQRAASRRSAPANPSPRSGSATDRRPTRCIPPP